MNNYFKLSQLAPLILWGLGGMSILFLSACGDDPKKPSPPVPAEICDSAECFLLDPPAEPKCYSPCSNGVEREDGTFVECDSDGLLEGCLGVSECINGSCLMAGVESDYPNCESDLQCPDHQICIDSSCYSYCDSDSECPGEFSCYRHVCRLPCETAVPGFCPDDTFCQATNSEQGYCFSLLEPTGDSTQVVGTFEVSDTEFALSNNKLSGTITVTNNSPRSVEFVMRKLSHYEYDDSGFTVITDNALHWLKIGKSGGLAQVQEFTFLVDGDGGSVELGFSDAANELLARWEGSLELVSQELGTKRINLTYRQKPDGQWTGDMLYFANFPDKGLAEWTADRANISLLQNIGNAFMQRWGGFKEGLLTYDEFNAMLASTHNESWKWKSLDRYCPDPNVACYLYDNPQGYKVYTSSLTEYPVPTGVTELPMAMNLATSEDDASILMGKIVSAQALHYAGDSAVNVQFESDPADCGVNAGGATICSITDFDASVLVGGRYISDAGDADCVDAPLDSEGAASFELHGIPWLLKGFETDTEIDSETGLRYRYECRDKLLPYGDDEELGVLNSSFAASNPIPDGRTRKRSLELVDGILINQDSLIIIFREHFDSFLGASDADGFSAYGVIRLRRSNADLDDEAFSGHSITDERVAPTDLLGTACSADVLQQAVGQDTMPDDVNNLAEVLINGYAATGGATEADIEFVHYFCEDTGLFDGGTDDGNSGAIKKIACPSGSRIQYFTLADGTLNQQDIADLNCQDGYSATSDGEIESRGSCQNTLNSWQQNELYGLVLDPAWRCSENTQAYCSLNRKDLREAKIFYEPHETVAAFLPLRADVDLAFRYKTRFQSRTGASVGFAPEICLPDSDQIPYCYSPRDIEASRARVDCAMELYLNHGDTLSVGNKDMLKQYLGANFSWDEKDAAGEWLDRPRDGFERLYAELLIMMGDESYTRAFASRFDLAGSHMRSFEGSLFEPDGINLAGGAGYEMYNLYQATQYYQLALDRFFSLSPQLWKVINEEGVENFVSKNTVVAYFDRLIRASSQKSRSWSEIAMRYKNFNRPDLARHVILRAYTAAYIESIILSRMMLELSSVVKPEDRPQIAERVEVAQLTYRSALLRMSDDFKSITDDISLFGYAPDYIPFPALDDDDDNAFEKILISAKSKLQTAAVKEDIALASTRSFDTDAALFQSELIELRNNYENQLAEICGTFEGDDGRIYPAIPKYAQLNERVGQVGDPCGLANGGALQEAMYNIDKSYASLQDVEFRYEDVFERINIERDRVQSYCDLLDETMEYHYEIEGGIGKLNTAVAVSEGLIAFLKGRRQHIYNTVTLQKCMVVVGTATGSNCPMAVSANLAYQAADKILTYGGLVARAAMLASKAKISSLENRRGKWMMTRDCDYAESDSDAKIAEMLLDLKHIDLDIYKAEIDLKIVASEIHGLRNLATRLMAQQKESEELTINVEAARNDPNVRIYKNDSVLTADRTFQSALREAYKVTKIYEYYTSQSYGYLGDLYLIRMISHGDITLESYLADLEDAFREFEELYGNPDLRVQIISLRDDIMSIPRSDENGQPLPEADRLLLFRDRLSDPASLDNHGYLAIPFSTTLGQLSPVTRNHKLITLEAEIVGSDVGDTIGRVYLRQRGTGTVQSLEDEKHFFLFPERMAVLDAFFNGERVFEREIYKNDRLRDRPFANSHWELVLNQKDEQVNKDINIESLSDIRLYVYYEDFTSL
ncbi:hypothetical protein KAI87_02380 [Myxococcota bacterium]|nr:hypothetical protein [Myxococcota bacterium]